MKDNQEEMFVVVNSHDDIVGYETRYKCHHNVKLIHRAVAMVIIDNKDRILIQKRSMQKDTDPGFWDITAYGHVSKGETYIQTAQRELFEEMGISGLTLNEQEKYIVYDKIETEMTMLYTTTYLGEVRFAPDEIESIQYIDKHNLINYKNKFTSGGIIALQKLHYL